MLNHKTKEQLLAIKDAQDLAKYIMVNDISLEIDDEDIQKHFEKYLDFGISEENGIIYDLRSK